MARVQVVSVERGVVTLVRKALQIAEIGIIPVVDRVALGIDDAGNAVLRITMEDNALPGRVQHAVVRDGESIAVQIRDLRQPGRLIDRVGESFGRGQNESRWIVDGAVSSYQVYVSR